MVNIGTELKININVEPMNGIHLSECDFTVTFYTNVERSLTISKSSMIESDSDNYIALVDSEFLGKGLLRMKLEIEVPDNDFPDGYRKEVEILCTDIVIH